MKPTVPVALAFLTTALVAGCAKPRRANYQAELATLDQTLLKLDSQARTATDGASIHVALAFHRYQRAALTASAEDLAAAASAIVRAETALGFTDDLRLLEANVALKDHRLDRAAAALSGLEHRHDSALVAGLLTDVAFEEGRLDDAAHHAERALAAGRSWDSIARLAYLKTQFGNFEEAERLYVQAQDEITAKEMRAWAWVEVQRGLIDGECGRHDLALDHYRRAGRAYSGFWFVIEHEAEALVALGRTREGIRLYRAVVEDAARPEYFEALGSALRQSGKIQEAKVWEDRALGGYLDSVRRGEVRYLHHLAEFYLTTGNDVREALAWAQRDFAVRRGPRSRQVLMWSLFRNGYTREALEHSRALLAAGICNARLLSQASVIHEAAGDTAEARRLREASLRINPLLVSTRGSRHQTPSGSTAPRSPGLPHNLASSAQSPGPAHHPQPL